VVASHIPVGAVHDIPEIINKEEEYKIEAIKKHRK